MAIDWSKAPEGATHWDCRPHADQTWMRRNVRHDKGWDYWGRGHWVYYGAIPEEQVAQMVAAPNSGLWNGEGLPPVGTECQINHVGEVNSRGKVWLRVLILAHHTDKRLQNPVAIYMPLDGGAHCDQAIAICFRPIRTPEQIAAEEREAQAKELFQLINPESKWHKCDHEPWLAAYDAGYRKQEPKPE